MASDSVSVVTEGIQLSSLNITDPPQVVTDFITELITLVTNDNYIIPPEQLIASYRSETSEINKQGQEEKESNRENSILFPPRPISYENDMFYICHRLKEFLHWSGHFCGSDRRLDLVQLTRLIPGISVKTDLCYMSGVRLQQIKVLKQFVGGYCGHYAYFNGLALLNATAAGDQQLSLTWLFLTGQRLAFWKRYWQTIRMLSSYAVLTGEIWPWVVQDIEKGCVERTYMSYLLTSDPSVLSHGRDRMHVLQFGFGSIQSPKRDLLSLHTALQDLIQRPVANSIAIMLGVTNHWLAAVIYKIRTRDEAWTSSTVSGECKPQGNTELTPDGYVYRVVFMDSNNAPIIEASESALEAYYLKHIVRYERRKKEKMSDWKRETFRQALEDERELMRIVISCVSGTSLLYCSIKSNIHRMMLNFYIHVDTVCQMRRLEYIPNIPIPWFLKHKNHTNPTNPEYQKYSTTGHSSPPDIDQYMLTLMAWLEGWYRPKDIRLMICSNMREFSIPELELELTTCLNLWSSHLLNILTGANQLGFPILIELVDVLIDISETLKKAI